MNMIRNKLREKNGLSIFMGLIFLLVCLMVGTVVLAASTAAAGKIAQQRNREQDYLNVASAARLLKDYICTLTYTHKTTGATFTEELTSSDGRTVILAEDLKELCRILAENAADTENTNPVEPQENLGAAKNFEISLDPGANPPDMEWDKVYGSLNMKADGKILVELWLGDEDKTSLNSHNHMAIEFCPEGPVTKKEVTHEASGGVITDINNVITTCSWPENGCTISKGKQ